MSCTRMNNDMNIRGKKDLGLSCSSVNTYSVRCHAISLKKSQRYLWQKMQMFMRLKSLLTNLCFSRHEKVNLFSTCFPIKVLFIDNGKMDSCLLIIGLKPESIFSPWFDATVNDEDKCSTIFLQRYGAKFNFFMVLYRAFLSK